MRPRAPLVRMGTRTSFTSKSLLTESETRSNFNKHTETLNIDSGGGLRVFRRNASTGGLVPIQSYRNATYLGASALALSPDETLLAVTYEKSCTLVLFNRSIEDGKVRLRKAWCTQNRSMLSMYAVEFSNDGQNIYTFARRNRCSIHTFARNANTGSWFNTQDPICDSKEYGTNWETLSAVGCPRKELLTKFVQGACTHDNLIRLRSSDRHARRWVYNKCKL